MIRWKLKDYLQQHNITAYRLSKATEGKVSLNAAYNATGDDLSAIKFETLDAIIKALRKLTKRKVRVTDLLEFEE